MKDNNITKRLLILAGITLLALYTIWPSIQLHSHPRVCAKGESADQCIPKDEYLAQNPELANKALKFGLDLAGGTSVVVELDTTHLAKGENVSEVVNTSLEILRNRVDQFGLSEPQLSLTPPNRITAELAGVDQDGAKELIGRTAKLEFKVVLDPDRYVPVLNRLSQQMQLAAPVAEAPKANAAATNSSVAVLSSSAVQKSLQDELSKQFASKDAKPTSVATPASSAAQLAKSDSLKKDTAKLAVADTAKKDSVAAQAPVVAEVNKAGLPKLPRSLIGQANSYIAYYDEAMVVRKADIDTVKMVLANPEVQRALGDIQLSISFETKKLTDGNEVRYLYALKKRAEMDGANVEGAMPERASGGMNAGAVVVNLRFNSKGAKQFAKVTGNFVGKQLAIVLDSQVVSAPKINDKISGGNAQISGSFTYDEAKQLAVILKAGALKTSMRIVELRTVGATLGDDNIQLSLKAGVSSLVMIILFMLWYYRSGGVNSFWGLLFNMVLIGAVLSMFGATLTLPGIAGLILIIGMAVDGNVLIFERIREEMAMGKSPRVAVHNGFSKAFSAIIDSHLTAIITSYILYKFGSGPIKGFGLTMIIGILATLFCNLYMSRTLFLWKLSKDESKISVGKGWDLFHDTKVDIIKISRWTNKISWGVSIIALVAFFYPGLNKSIDFTGGQVITFDLPTDVPVAEVKATLENQAGFEDALVKEVSSNGKSYYQLRLHPSASTAQVVDQVCKVFKINTKEERSKYIISEELVGPSISKDLVSAAWWSIFWALLAILIYIWFRFGKFGLGFGLGGIITLAHDILVTVLLFVIFRLEVDAAFIAALLTILGYSLNDSIIIYDRIRENTELLGRDSYESRVNRSVNETFARTIITSGTVFITCVLLAVFGAGSIKNFAIAMAIGVGVGTYSSIFISAPFVNWWAKKYGVKGVHKEA